MLLRHTLAYLPAQLLAPVIQLGAIVGWTHWLSPEAYGLLAYLIAAHEFCIVPAIVWWSSYLLRYASGFEGGAERLRRTETTVLGLAVIVQTLVGVGVLATMSAAATPALAIAFLLYGATRTLLFNAGERARAATAFGDYTAAQLGAPAIGIAVGFAAMALAGPGVEAALGGFAVGQAAALAWIGRRRTLRWGRPDRAIIVAALRFGAPVTIAGLVGWVSLNGIRIIVERADGLAAVGLLSVGWTLGQRVAIVAAMLVTAAGFPLVLKRLREEGDAAAKHHLGVNIAVLLAALVPVAVGTVFVAPAAVTLLIAEPFRAATLAILPVAAAAGAIRNARQHGPDQAFLIFERSSVLMWLYIVEAGVTMALAFVGAHRGGMVGAAWGCLAGAVVTAFVSVGSAWIFFRAPMPLGHAARIAVAAGLMALGLSGLDFPVSALGLAAEIVVGAAIYVTALAGLYAPELRGALRARRDPALAAMPAE